MLITNAQTKRWTRDEYYRLADFGILSPDERVELIEGEIVAMSPQTPSHSYALRRGNMALAKLFGGTHTVCVQLPLDLNEDSQPEPDFALIPHSAVRSDAHPTTADLVIEVSNSSLAFDQNEKARLYAKAGIEEYWVVDLVHGRVEVYREPSATGYRLKKTCDREESVEPLRLTGEPFELSIFF